MHKAGELLDVECIPLLTSEPEVETSLLTGASSLTPEVDRCLTLLASASAMMYCDRQTLAEVFKPGGRDRRWQSCCGRWQGADGLVSTEHFQGNERRTCIQRQDGADRR